MFTFETQPRRKQYNVNEDAKIVKCSLSSLKTDVRTNSR